MFRWLGAPLLRLALGIRVENRPELAGPYVVVANHSSFLDPLLLGAASPRHVCFLMAAFVWRGRALNWFYRWMRAIPLSPRGGNRDALRAAKQILARGEVLGVFPEGGISRDGLLMLGSPGAVALVLSEEVPIVPCGIVGAHATLPFGSRRIRRKGVVVRFGAPLEPRELVPHELPRKQRLAFATRRIMQEIARLSGQVAREDVLEQVSGIR